MKKSILTKIILMVFLCLFSIFFRETKIAFAASSLSSLTNPSLTDIFVINESSSINLHTAIVSKNGDYLCLWDNRTLNNGMDIFGQFFSLDGTPQGSILNFTPFIMDQDAPAIDSDTNSFLMVWEDRRGAINPDPIKNTGWDIYGALINLKGEIIKEIVIDSSTGDQKLPRVKYNGRHYLVVWEDWQNHDIKTSNVRL